MFDFTITSTTRVGMIICTLLYFFIVFNYWKKSTNLCSDANNKLNYGLFFFILIFAIISWYNGDWFHYKLFLDTTAGPGSNSGMEAFYEHLALWVGRNYLLFRIVVWGSALTLLYFSLKNLNVNSNCALLLLLIVFITYFDYSRTALGVGVYFFGLSIVGKRESTFKTILGIAILCCAFFFHRSTILLTALTITCIFPLNKKNIIFIILVTLVSFSLLKGLFVDFMTDIIDAENELSGKADFYMSGERSALISGNFNGIVMGLWTNSVFYVFFFVVTICFFKKENFDKIPRNIGMVYNILFGLMLFSTLMYFFRVGHGAFYYRYLSMTYFPIVIITTYLYTEGLMTHKTFKNLCLYGGGNVAVTFLYRCMIGA